MTGIRDWEKGGRNIVWRNNFYIRQLIYLERIKGLFIQIPGKMTNIFIFFRIVSDPECSVKRGGEFT
jgi:hypothetical protein